MESRDIEFFTSICRSIFKPEELEGQEWRIQEIFRLFDSDNDGYLNSQEEERFDHWTKIIRDPINALLVVDVQNDFIDGSLAVRDGVDVVEPINRLIREGRFDAIIYSQDWHPENHISFYENLHLRELHPKSEVTKENAKLFDTVIFESSVEQKLWPKHCVNDTWGAELHKSLMIAPNSERVLKGQNPEKEAYSVFASDNHSKLDSILRDKHVSHLYVCGLAYDFCVKATCLDGLRLGYAVTLIDDCCRAVDEDNIQVVNNLIVENCGLITNSDEVLSMVNSKKLNLTMSHQTAKVISRSATKIALRN